MLSANTAEQGAPVAMDPRPARGGAARLSGLARRAAAGAALFGLGGLAGAWLTASPRPVEATPVKAVVSSYFSPGGGAEAALIAAIEGSKREALCAVFLFTSRPVAAALKRAKARGVDVRVITDKSNVKIPNSQGKELEDAGIPVLYADLGKTGDNQPIKFHHKYAVIDQELAVTGSYNWTRQADTDNRENLIVLHGKPVAQAFRENFAREWEALAPR